MNLALRDQVHSELTRLHSTGGALNAVPEAVKSFLDHRPLLVALAAQYRSTTQAGELDRRAAIITAGPPGAGKSTALAEVQGYRRIDADEIKTLVLRRLSDEDLLGMLASFTLPDGRPVKPGEVAGWVHSFSARAADRVRDECLKAGENFVMEGTLSWPPLPERYANELAEHDYIALRVIDVEVPEHVAIEQARQRWWKGRSDPANTAGGRFMPDVAISRLYTATGASACAPNARQLQLLAIETAGIPATVEMISRGAGAEHRAVLDADGEVHPWHVDGCTTPPLGAACTGCGQLLTEKNMIAAGTHPDCEAA
ncbi:hypothetical protein CGZ93_08445 [Enemella dayhoffiae]|uniref:UDP-N-acetylglucosamine kinase n=1 Tax=Enemella dayhoffiae TaxID=2016507 RepID=A0A255H2S2_9ACTN|nr:zeta toxin family protein [Enemella dayhoffiae]OYO21955.1 hypothetical protein CGZ93_08445 [Enemella dayhoffiae]